MAVMSQWTKEIYVHDRRQLTCVVTQIAPTVICIIARIMYHHNLWPLARIHGGAVPCQTPSSWIEHRTGYFLHVSVSVGVH